LAALLFLAAWSVGGCAPGPKTLVIDDAHTREPMGNVLLVLAIEKQYAVRNDISRRLYWNSVYQWRRRNKIYGWGSPRQHICGPGGFPVNPEAVPYFSPEATNSYYLRLQRIASGWRIFRFDLPLDDNEPTDTAVGYWLVKANYVPRHLTFKQMRILADATGDVTIALETLAPGSQESNLSLIDGAGQILGAMMHYPHKGLDPNAVLSALQACLQRLVEFVPQGEGKSPYLDFPKHQAQAKHLMQEIRQLRNGK